MVVVGRLESVAEEGGTVPPYDRRYNSTPLQWKFSSPHRTGRQYSPHPSSGSCGGQCPVGGNRRALLDLKEKSRGQARLLLTARRKIRQHVDLTGQLQRERDSTLRNINSQLLLLEANLRRRQDELSALILEKDNTIRNQQRIMVALASAYSQVTGKSEVCEVLSNADKDNPELDLPKILKEILATSTELSKARESENKTKDDIEENEKNNSKVENVGKLSDENTTIDTPNSTLDRKSVAESVNDTDSAIMLEDTYSDSIDISPFMKEGVKIIRSVSDVLECPARPMQVPSEAQPKKSDSANEESSNISNSSDSNTVGKSNDSNLDSNSQLELTDQNNFSNSRTSSMDDSILDDKTDDSNKQLRTLSKSSSLELDCSDDLAPSLFSQYNSESTLSEGSSSDDDEITDSLDELSLDDSSHQLPDRRLLVGSSERLDAEVVESSTRRFPTKPDDKIQVTYNRVMSNHRSVTKVKDVKYKRINKAKSRSLEELRGKLKIREMKNKQLKSISVGHSYA